MPKWLSRRPQPPEKPAPSVQPSAPKASPPKNSAPSAGPARRAADLPPEPRTADLALDDASAVQARLRQDLNELLKAHRQQGRVLERNQKLLEQTEQELSRQRGRASALETEVAEQRTVSGEQVGRIHDLEQIVDRQSTLQTAYEALDRERQDLSVHLADLTRSRANATAERDRLAAQLAGAHATIAARDAEVAALQIDQDGVEARISGLQSEIEQLKRGNGKLRADLDRALEAQAAQHHLQLEFDALSARWDVARAQLAEAESALKSSQATIKAAQRLSSSVEWRLALDGVLDAASELVRFERGTLALVDELQEELKVEAARNSPIAVSEMSRFKVGEGIAGWALSHREPVLVRDTRSDPRFKASDPKHQPRSFIAVPLLADKEGLGVLTVARPATDPFTEHDLRNLARVATDAANALINARLVDLLKHREDRLTTLVRKARELSTANDTKQVIEFVLSSAKELVGGKAALLALRNQKTLELEVTGSVGVSDAVIEQRIAWGAPAAGDVMRTGKPWVSPIREMLPPALVETVEKAGLKMIASVLCGPLAHQELSEDGALLSRSELEVSDQVSGVLNVYRDTLDPIPSADLEQLKAFAEQAAVAIQNVRRWDRVKEQLQATSSMNTRLMGRERYINQLLFRIQQLEQELSRYKAA
ncbi:MAG: GAF domain-containing protein [Chloroflexi bacterium]|nr:MAG: GAF domain-containing protein [Chloroflexota bacterium]TMG43198.1 MAG: GAF domain-containing protein [Chloroflexota bacterium]